MPLVSSPALGEAPPAVAEAGFAAENAWARSFRRLRSEVIWMTPFPAIPPLGAIATLMFLSPAFFTERKLLELLTTRSDRSAVIGAFLGIDALPLTRTSIVSLFSTTRGCPFSIFDS